MHGEDPPVAVRQPGPEGCPDGLRPAHQGRASQRRGGIHLPSRRHGQSDSQLFPTTWRAPCCLHRGVVKGVGHCIVCRFYVIKTQHDKYVFKSATKLLLRRTTNEHVYTASAHTERRLPDRSS